MLKAIDEARALVADNHLNGYEPIESVEFPKGVKPAPLEAYSQD
jgi:hypothetical protein